MLQPEKKLVLVLVRRVLLLRGRLLGVLLLLKGRVVRVLLLVKDQVLRVLLLVKGQVLRVLLLVKDQVQRTSLLEGARLEPWAFGAGNTGCRLVRGQSRVD